MLGEYRCSSAWCLALVRSTDAGKHFTRVGLPPFPSQGTEPTLEFATALDGFAYVPDEGPLWVTHDGGEYWHRAGPTGHVVAFAAAAGYAYVVTDRRRFERTLVTRNAWRGLAFPTFGRRYPFSLAVRGSRVWLLGTPWRLPANHADELARSTDGGRRFTSGPGPCSFDLGGRLVSAGRDVVWAVCPSGMMAGLRLSTDGGRSFPLRRSFHDPGGTRLPGLTNGAEIFSLSTDAALLYAGAQGPLLRTSDAGARWIRLRRTSRIGDVFWLDFSTSRIGAAVFTIRSHPGRPSFWRTTDGGASWRTVPFH